MKASELVAELQQHIATFGDSEVVVDHPDFRKQTLGHVRVGEVKATWYDPLLEPLPADYVPVCYLYPDLD